jgi:hypothetical protein
MIGRSGIMSWKGKSVSALNRMIAPAGLMVEKTWLDFDARLTSETHINRMHKALAEAFQGWVEIQKIIEKPVTFNIIEHVFAFYEQYLKSPFRTPHGGSRYNNALWLSLLSRAINPGLIVDSGTYEGASAWVFAIGAPDAKIYSFDIDLSHIRKREANCVYREHDWMVHEFREIDCTIGLCYFDDHVDQAKRLIEARSRGFLYAIFDDDFNVTSFAPYAHESNALPKVEFILDDSLLDGELITWTSGNSLQSWTADRSYLERARATIDQTERLPDTSPITGIHQTPYRIVRLKR